MLLLILSLITISLVIAYHDEKSSVIWINTDGYGVMVNSHHINADPHHVLNHFYNRGYDLGGHSMSDHYKTKYSWTMCIRQKQQQCVWNK
jgi:hypothetical protein